MSSTLGVFELAEWKTLLLGSKYQTDSMELRHELQKFMQLVIQGFKLELKTEPSLLFSNFLRGNCEGEIHQEIKVSKNCPKTGQISEMGILIEVLKVIKILQ